MAYLYRIIEKADMLQDMKRVEVGDREITPKKNGWLGNPTVYLIKDHNGPFRVGATDTVIYRDMDL